MIFDGLAGLPDFVQPVAMTFAIVAIVTFLGRDNFELNPLSWFMYSTFATMLVFSLNVFREIGSYVRVGDFAWFVHGIDWQPDFIWGPMALLFALPLCRWFLPGFGYWQFSDVSNCLAGQVGLYWLFPFAIGLFPWFGELLSVLIFVMAPVLFLLALVRPRDGGIIIMRSHQWGDDDWY
jgi:hypothetical protein